MRLRHLDGNSQRDKLFMNAVHSKLDFNHSLIQLYIVSFLITLTLFMNARDPLILKQLYVTTSCSTPHGKTKETTTKLGINIGFLFCRFQYNE